MQPRRPGDLSESQRIVSGIRLRQSLGEALRPKLTSSLGLGCIEQFPSVMSADLVMIVLGIPHIGTLRRFIYDLHDVHTWFSTDIYGQEIHRNEEYRPKDV